MANDAKNGYVAVDGAPGYSINHVGTVLNKSGSALRHQLVSGYLVVFLAIGEAEHRFKKARYVHRLLAEAFIAKPSDWDESWKVLPVNGIKTDIQVSNLQWMDMKTAYKHARKKPQ